MLAAAAERHARRDGSSRLRGADCMVTALVEPIRQVRISDLEIINSSGSDKLREKAVRLTRGVLSQQRGRSVDVVVLVADVGGVGLHAENYRYAQKSA
jgi:hypothetical protein